MPVIDRGQSTTPHRRVQRLALCVVPFLLASCSGDVELEAVPDADVFAAISTDGSEVLVAVDIDGGVVKNSAAIPTGDDAIASSTVAGDGAGGHILSWTTSESEPTVARISPAGTDVEIVESAPDTGVFAFDGQHLVSLLPVTADVAQLDVRGVEGGGESETLDLDFTPQVIHGQAGHGTLVAAWEGSDLTWAVVDVDGALSTTRNSTIEGGQVADVDWVDGEVVAAIRSDDEAPFQVPFRPPGSPRLVPVGLSTTVVHSSQAGTVFDDEVDGRRVLRFRAANGNSYSQGRSSDAPILGVHVTDDGRVAALLPTAVAIWDPLEGSLSTTELSGETSTTW